MALCPTGFDIPDDMFSSKNIYINQTISNCSISCLDSPFYTKIEYQIFLSADFGSLLATTICALIVLCVWTIDWIKSEHIFVNTCAAVLFVLCAILSSIAALGNKRFCRTNTIPIDGSDGLTTCSFEGALRLGLFMFFCVCFAAQSIDAYIKVVLKRKTASYKGVYVSVMLLVPFVSMCLGLTFGVFGYGMNTNQCSVVAIEHPVSVVISAIFPVSIVIGLGCSVAVFVEIVRLRFHSTATISESDYSKFARTSLRFLVFSGLYLVSLVLNRFLLWQSFSSKTQSILDYGRCALQYFTGTEESYISECGALPSRIIPFGEQMFVVVWSHAGLGIFFFVVNVESLVEVTNRLFLSNSVVVPDGYELPASSAATSEYKSSHMTSTMRAEVALSATGHAASSTLTVLELEMLRR